MMVGSHNGYTVNFHYTVKNDFSFLLRQYWCEDSTYSLLMCFIFFYFFPQNMAYPFKQMF